MFTKKVVLTFVSIFIFAFSIYAQKPEFIWQQKDNQTANKLIKEFGGELVTHSNTLQLKPPFYDGSLPVRFTTTYKSRGGGYTTIDIPLIYDFGSWFTVLIYLKEESTLASVPDGAVAVDKNSGNVVAEAKTLLINRDSESAEIEEFHYDQSGKLVFKCKSNISVSTDFKTNEIDKKGKKIQDYFFIYPISNRWKGF